MYDEGLVGDRENLPNLVSDGKNLSHFQNGHKPSRSWLIIHRSHSKGLAVDPLVSIALVLPLDLVTPDFIRNTRSNDICVGKLFDSKYNLVLNYAKFS